MQTEKILRYHFKIFEMFSVWEPEMVSMLYRIWPIICLISVGLLLPLTLFMAIIYTEDKETALKIQVNIKCVLTAYNRAKFNKLLAILREMDEYVDSTEESLMGNIFRTCRKIHLAFSRFYYIAYLVNLLEFISSRIGLFWPSTRSWPWEWAQSPKVFFGVIIFQITTNAINCILAALTDSVPSILCLILDGHLAILGQKLGRLGHDKKQSNLLKDVKELIKCVERIEYQEKRNTYS